MLLHLMLMVAAMSQANGPVPDPHVAEPTVIEDVVVTGQEPEAIESFVDALTIPRRRGQAEGQIARWNEPVCIKVIGSEPAVNAYLLEQVNGVFKSLGVATGSATCRANAMVVVANDAGGFAKAFAERYRVRLFRNRRAQIDSFIGPSRPIRWMHATRAGAAGTAMLPDTLLDAFGGESAGLPNTRLSLSTAENIDRAMVVIDPRSVRGVRGDGLSAYIAFALLVELPPAPEAGSRPSILNLFDGDDRSAATTGLTAWDRAFLEGVYAMRSDQQFRFQRLQIERRMQAALSDGSGGEGPP